MTVEAVFEHWKQVMGSSRARLDTKRSLCIKHMLAAGYEAEDLMLAIDGCKLSPFHMGQNDRNQVYNALTLILRNADQVDKFIAIAEADQRRTQRVNAERKALEPATTGTGAYKEQRSALLSLVKSA